MAGVSTKDIKNRIRSMESTKQITKAMEMVAASKLRQAQNRVLASRPYFEILYQTITDITESNRDFSSPYLRKREGNRALMIVVAFDLTNTFSVFVSCVSASTYVTSTKPYAALTLATVPEIDVFSLTAWN